MVFDQSPRYGKGLDFGMYSVHDAATCLLRYLKRLPEPVIPYAFYDKFTSVLGPTIYENDDGYDREAFSEDDAFSTIQQSISELPPVNRQLLVYLLDIAAVFASKAYRNKMTPARIVAAFQPSLLAREASTGMSVLDHVRAADTLVFMVENQDKFLMDAHGELIQMADPATTTSTRDQTEIASETEMRRTHNFRTRLQDVKHGGNGTQAKLSAKPTT